MTHEKQERRYRYGPGAPCVDEIERDAKAKQERIQGQGGAKHTPGPWKIGGPTKSVGITIWRGNEGDGPWARICRNVSSAADAKLIAAAPELLAVAIDAVRRCASLHGDSFETHKCPTCEPTRAAIAKALGYSAALRKAGRE